MMLDRLYDAWVPRFEDAARRAFEQDRRAVIALLSEAKSAAARSKATVNYVTVAQAVRSELLSEAGARWRSAFLPVLTAEAVAHAEAWNAAMGIEWDVRNPRSEQWFHDYELQFAQPILQTTSDDLSALLEQAQREGWSIPTTQRRTETLFEQYMHGNLSSEDFAWFEQRMPAHRTELIARTELIRSSNAGSHALFRDWGAQQKEWMSAHDARTRADHSAADGQVVPIDAPFTVGGYPMQYPGDPNAPLSQTAQCRCAVAPVIAAEQVVEPPPAPAAPAPPPRPRFSVPDNVTGTYRAQDFLTEGYPDVTINNASAYVPANDAKQAKQDIMTTLGARLKGNPDFDAYVQRRPLQGAAWSQDSHESNVASLVNRWAITSDSEDPTALALQRAAEVEFDLPEHPRFRKRQQAWAMAEDDYNENGAAYRAFLREMHTHTQERLAAAGIDRVQVWRGMGVNERLDPSEIGFTRAPVRLQAMSSTSASQNTARYFSMTGTEGGRVVMVEVPREAVIGTARTGFGCFEEAEFVVLGYEGDGWVVTYDADDGPRSQPAIDNQQNFQEAIDAWQATNP